MNTINWQPAHLEDGLVKLVPLAADDFDRLYRVAADPLIWEQHPSSDRYKENVFRGFFNGAVESKAAFLIVDKASGEVIGSTRYYDQKEDSVAIGFTFLAKEYWGGRYNKAVKKLMIDYAFGFVSKVIFHIGATNLRSQIATGRLGAVKTGEFFTEDGNGRRLSFEFTLERK
ncbi:MAG TPA: GNAT family N-acetyltransferase [Chitinophagaceae bacterium]|nr:GNAT family N-acetyltransferase [Chitinophagaceae bacterium]